MRRRTTGLVGALAAGCALALSLSAGALGAEPEPAVGTRAAVRFALAKTDRAQAARSRVPERLTDAYLREVHEPFLGSGGSPETQRPPVSRPIAGMTR